MNRRRRAFLFAPSSLALSLLLWNGRLLSLPLVIAAALLLVWAELAYLSGHGMWKRKAHAPLSAALGAVLCHASCGEFHQTWITSVHVMNALISRFFPDYALGLRVLTLLVGLAALPSAACLAAILLRAVDAIDYRELWREGKALFRRLSWKRAGGVLARIVLAGLAGTLLLTAVYCIPTDRIEAHMERSARLVLEEGPYPALTEHATSTLDNLTDSIMLLEAAYRSSPPQALRDAMAVPRGGIRTYPPNDSLVGHYVDARPFEELHTYARYWHGFLLFLKPLLLLLDYGQIRLLNGAVQALCVLSLCFLLWKKGQRAAILPWLLAYGMLMPTALAKSLQFSACFYVPALGCAALLLLREEERKEKSRLVFLYCGILTPFFDFLTYPLACFGVPMTLSLLLSGTESAEKKLCGLFENACMWCAGYAGTWVLKWGLASLVTGGNVLLDGMQNASVRIAATSPDGLTKYSVGSCIARNYAMFLTTPVTAAAVLLAGVLVYRCVKRNRLSFDAAARVLFPFLLTGLAPVAWFAFATNHTTIHAFFANKTCVISLLALLLGLAALLRAERSGDAVGEEPKP